MCKGFFVVCKGIGKGFFICVNVNVVDKFVFGFEWFFFFVIIKL